MTPQILDIFVTWPYYGYASTGGELIEVTEYFLNYLSKYIARDTNQDRKINVFMSFFKKCSGERIYVLFMGITFQSSIRP